ncbi:MAG TPA: MFS transporter [Planctomycetaceae bacterium]|jgi:MFS family permease|nr:MFS transporter [Planctomycetaceae bacterium]
MARRDCGGKRLVADRVSEPPAGPWAPFRWPDFRSLFGAAFCSTLASRALAVVLGYEVYALTGNPLALGMLGLIEVIPAVSLALYGGHIADRRDRRQILRITLGALVVCACALAAVEASGVGHAKLLLLYGVVFVAGIARGFAEPAAQALEAQVVPFKILINSSTLMASCWMSAAVVGPLAGGFSYQHLGAAWTFAGIAVLYGLAWIATTLIAPRPRPAPPEGESIWQSVAVGVRYVLHDQILLGSMSLDLFAVLFGGAIAMLPIFAKDILKVDATGLGMLNAAPTLGALVAVLFASRRPPVRHAGRTLFLAVTGFGVAMIVFALSRTFWLSMVALAFSGLFDGLSVVIRRAINRLFSPDHLRGRIASVSTIFIGSSNELGAFESGMMAAWLGTVRSVWVGGILTLVVVSFAAVMAPKLRKLSLDPSRLSRRDQEIDCELDAEEVASR